MTAPTRRHLAPSDAGPALHALTAWTPARAPGGGVHPGDLGWHLRLPGADVLLWTAGDEPMAAGFLDGDVLRVTTAPGADLPGLAADATGLAASAVDGLPIPGWQPRHDEPRLVLSRAPQPVPAAAGRARPVTGADVPDRVLVQRTAFTGSTFTVDRWHTMRQSPAGHLAVDVLVRTPAGEPAAAATGWFAGPGRCGLLEPVGTHPGHRGHGYGRDAVLGACGALTARGASAVAVVTPASNEAAVALYRSAGFTVVGENHVLVRPERSFPPAL